MNRSPRPQERYPLPPRPWLGLSAAVAAPLLFLLVASVTEVFWAFGVPVGPDVSVPVGYVLLAVTVFPLMMPPDVRYLAALVSAALLGGLALLWVLSIGPFLVPVVILLFLAWAFNHPTLLASSPS